jgi:putative FmdB family regulatory protein
MPTYEYRCSECGNQFEIVQRIDEEHLTVCERCGGRLRKVFHPAGIVFKGSGFYATDSRSKAKAGAKDSRDSSGSKETGESKSDKSDSKETKSTEKSGDKSGEKAASKKPSGSESSS